ncbi:MAG: HEAT repeat domain-containing protein [Candidatus Riflebacteria bacterium]|nr:HEAT repeat domain-containing protein [Candidatus Riflebacteria bacterium]
MDKTPNELIASFDESLWRQGIEALAIEHTLIAAETLIGLLSDIMWRKREAAAKALIEWGVDIVPLLLNRANSQNKDELYWVLYVIGHFENSQGLTVVQNFLKSPDAEIRGYAIRAITISKVVSRARILYELLNDSSWAVRKLVFERLLTFGPIILDDLRAMLEKSKDDPLHSVVALFSNIGGLGVIGELFQLYSDGSFSMRYSLITSLGNDDSNEIVDFLIQALSDPSWVIRKKAAELLTLMGTKVFERLSAWFGRGDSLMKHQIVCIIVDLLGDRALPLLRRLIGSNEQENRILAIESLGRLPGDESSRILIKCLADPQRIVADYASDCLSRKEKLNLDLLLEHLNTDDENMRFLVVKTIGSIGGLALNPIIRILQEGDKQERLFLLGVLQKIHPNETLVEALVGLLADPNWPVRNAAANCLKAFGENAVSSVVQVLSSSNEDTAFWAKKVLLSMGVSAVVELTRILRDGTDVTILPHIVSALLAIGHSDAVPAVLQFFEKSDDNRVQAVIDGILEISSREVVETILNFLNHPDDRVVFLLSQLLSKVQKPGLRRTVLLGISHPEERCRFAVLEAINKWKQLDETELKSLVRQLEVEKNPRTIKSVVRILSSYPLPNILEEMKLFLTNLEPELMLDLMLEIAMAERPQANMMLAELLKARSHSLRETDVERVGKILGLIFRSRPEGIIQGLSSPIMAYRFCSVVALEQIEEKRIAFSLMDNLRATEDPKIVKRAVKILTKHFFSEDFRLKGAVTDYLLNLGIIICEPVCEIIAELENEIDRKSLIDLIESVGGKVDASVLRKKSDSKVVISDAVLDDVLDRRKRAVEDLEKYDKIIQTSHTQELTIMFTDVKGYTAFSSKASLSEVMSMLKQHDEILLPVIEKYSGRVLKKIGDAFLVIFEVPREALLSAIEVQRKLKEYNETVPDERRLAVRVAINTGPVIRRENDVFGDAVNVASRLEGIADAQEIVISESTFKLVDSGVFEITPFGDHRLKGLDKPVKTFKVIW